MVQSHSLIWWEQILAFGKRDQMSFDFALQAAGARLEHLPGWKHDSDLIHDTPNIQPNRVHANFDPVRYAWAHRGDAAAQADPRRHYLEQGRLEWRRYSVPAELLEFLCHRQRSSLGARIAPRRAMAAGLQDLLQARSLQQGRLLVLRVSEGGALGFEAEELDRAEQALVAFLAGHRGARLEVKAAELASGRLALRAGEHEFDLLLLIGLPGELLEQALILVRASLAPAGLLVAMCCSSASLAKLAEFEAAIAAQRGPVRSSVHASRHDGLDAPLSNSLLAFEWGG
jgi:hypothetical protein